MSGQVSQVYIFGITKVYDKLGQDVEPSNRFDGVVEEYRKKDRALAR